MSTFFEYSPTGDKTKETDPLGNFSTWSYTDGTEPAYLDTGTMPVGLVETATDPNGNTTTYEYNRAGDLRRRVDPNGHQTVFTYDALGRVLTQSSIADSVTRTTTFQYDKLGRRTRQTDPTTVNQVSGQSHALVTDWGYDKNSRVTSVTQSDSFGNDPTRTTTNTYQADGRLETTTDPMSGVTTTTYDQAGNPITVTDPAGRVYRTTYDYAQRPIKLELVNFVDPAAPAAPRTITVSTTTYDAVGRVSHVSDNLGNTTEYTYDTARSRAHQEAAQLPAADRGRVFVRAQSSRVRRSRPPHVRRLSRRSAPQRLHVRRCRPRHNGDAACRCPRSRHRQSCDRLRVRQQRQRHQADLHSVAPHRRSQIRVQLDQPPQEGDGRGRDNGHRDELRVQSGRPNDHRNRSAGLRDDHVIRHRRSALASPTTCGRSHQSERHDRYGITDEQGRL